MPALILFKRRWQVGGDDFVFPAIASVCVRLMFLASAVVVYVVQHPSVRQCVAGELLTGFLIGLVVILGVTILLETAVGVVSGRGTITDSYPRRLLPALLYTRTVVFLFEIAGSVVGAVWVFSDWEPDTERTCDISLVRLVQAAVVLGWFLLIALTICVIFLFGGKPRRENDSFDDYELWEKRCRLCCFCERKDENSQIAYAEAAAVFSSIFQGLDVVPSDIVAGLILVQVEQEWCRRNRISNTSPHKNPGPDVLLPTEEVETRLETVWHYFRFSLASNGWPILVNSNIICWLCKLCCVGRCGECMKGSDRIVGDNCCQCNTTAIRAMEGLEEDDLLHVSFHNQIFQSPFYVALDHSYKSVVISIRGTLSFKDMLTDVSADAEMLDVVGYEIYAHRGIVNNSKYILNKLKELNLLEEAFERHPDYKLVVSGHSLGAGVAAILSILLREQYPDIKTYAFAPPGGLINAEGVFYTQDFVTSVVLGEDIVPRMSVCTIQQLRDQIISVVRNSQVPKYRILLRGLWYSCRGLPDKLPRESEECDGGMEEGLCCNPREPLLSPGRGGSLLDSPREEEPSSHNTGEEGDEGTREGQSATLDVSPVADQPSGSRRGRCRKEFMDLFPPGQMIWLTRKEMHSGGCCGSREEYRAQWVTHRQFDNIGVRPGMVKDHLPLDIDAALAWLVERIQSGYIVHPNPTSDDEM
ncbi:diacylglycerol lipase-beta-like [Diadema setosum]|uniref:diacylglycerol lipase-beta-like n=1 Tax=Diadema setosum TaxID=31175 RepID=UPI003B3BAF0E